jgi:hypothetical protein
MSQVMTWSPNALYQGLVLSLGEGFVCFVDIVGIVGHPSIIRWEWNSMNRFNLVTLLCMS